MPATAPEQPQARHVVGAQRSAAHLTRSQAMNQVATTLTGLAVAFFGGVAILMRPMQSDISTLKADMAGLKSDVAGLKSDVAGLKSDVGQIKVNLNVSMLLTVAGFVSLGVLVFTTSR
jgi:hypothetical protein